MTTESATESPEKAPTGSAESAESAGSAQSAGAAETREPVLDVTGLEVHYGPRRRRRRALGGGSLSVAPGETVGVIGETGSGKSTFARAVLGLVRASAGSIVIGGEDVSTHGKRQWRDLRRRGVVQTASAAGSPRPWRIPRPTTVSCGPSWWWEPTPAPSRSPRSSAGRRPRPPSGRTPSFSPGSRAVPPPPPAPGTRNSTGWFTLDKEITVGDDGTPTVAPGAAKALAQVTDRFSALLGGRTTVLTPAG